jgi:hypothetical protein
MLGSFVATFIATFVEKKWLKFDKGSESDLLGRPIIARGETGATPHRSLPGPIGGLSRKPNDMITILLIVLIVALISSVPAWPYSREWGYAPSGGIGTVLLILLILWLLGVI